MERGFVNIRQQTVSYDEHGDFTFEPRKTGEYNIYSSLGVSGEYMAKNALFRDLYNKNVDLEVMATQTDCHMSGPVKLAGTASTQERIIVFEWL